MGYTDIKYEKKDGVVRVTINRPEADNNLTTHTFTELGAAFREAEGEEDVGVVVLTGAGDRAFSVGGNVKAHIDRTPTSHRVHFARLVDASIAMRTMGKPIIAAVNGRCIGSANQLQLLCDLSIASDQAIFGQHGSKRGGAPVFWGAQLLTHFVGERKAREMVFLSRQYTAKEAEAMGLINKAVPHKDLYAEVDRWCQEILSMSPTSLRILKVSLNYKTDLCYPAIWHARELLGLFTGTEERLEGTKAYVEGRKANFSKFRK